MFHLSVMCTSIPSETFSKGIIIIVTKIELSIYISTSLGSRGVKPKDSGCLMNLIAGLVGTYRLKGCCIYYHLMSLAQS